jgi:hypothetical protein
MDFGGGDRFARRNVNQITFLTHSRGRYFVVSYEVEFD